MIIVINIKFKFKFKITEPATDLDDFKSIVIEPTINAISRMSIFIGDRKYKEDFIWKGSQQQQWKLKIKLT